MSELMDPDTEDAALAHQQELEAQHYNEILANDPGYQQWVMKLDEVRDHEICSETNNHLRDSPSGESRSHL